MLCYFLGRSDCDGYYLCGTSPEHIAEAIRNELVEEFGEEIPAEERSVMTLYAKDLTERQIDELPEFGGW